MYSGLSLRMEKGVTFIQENIVKEAPCPNKKIHRLSHISWRIQCNKQRILRFPIPNEHPVYYSVYFFSEHNMNYMYRKKKNKNTSHKIVSLTGCIKFVESKKWFL